MTSLHPAPHDAIERWAQAEGLDLTEIDGLIAGHGLSDSAMAAMLRGLGCTRATRKMVARRRHILTKGV